MKLRNFLPLIIFIGLALALANITNLANSPRLWPNLIGKKLAPFETTDLLTGEKITHEDLSKEITILNLWASWCTPCQAEHDVIMDLKKKGYKVYSLNVADIPENAKKYLKDFGNPYDKIGIDPKREITIGMGATGTPETYVINTDGVIYFHQRGLLDADTANKQLIPIIDELKKKNH